MALTIGAGHGLQWQIQQVGGPGSGAGAWGVLEKTCAEIGKGARCSDAVFALWPKPHPDALPNVQPRGVSGSFARAPKSLCVLGSRRTFAVPHTPKDECDPHRPVTYCPDQYGPERPCSSGVASHKLLRLGARPKAHPQPRQPQGASCGPRRFIRNIAIGSDLPGSAIPASKNLPMVQISWG